MISEYAEIQSLLSKIQDCKYINSPEIFMSDRELPVF